MDKSRQARKTGIIVGALALMWCGNVVAMEYEPRIVVKWYKEVNGRFRMKGTEIVVQRIISSRHGTQASCLAANRKIERHEFPVMGITKESLIAKTAYCVPVDRN